MFIKLFRIIRLNFCPPKIGETYYGDPLSFVMGKPVEAVLHGLKDKFGQSIFIPVPSEGCYKLIIECITEDYYIIVSEVFCRKFSNGEYVKDNLMGYWMKRTQSKKISKGLFRDLVIEGMLKRGLPYEKNNY